MDYYFTHDLNGVPPANDNTPGSQLKKLLSCRGLTKLREAIPGETHAETFGTKGIGHVFLVVKGGLPRSAAAANRAGLVATARYGLPRDLGQFRNPQISPLAVAGMVTAESLAHEAAFEAECNGAAAVARPGLVARQDWAGLLAEAEHYRRFAAANDRSPVQEPPQVFRIIAPIDGTRPALILALRPELKAVLDLLLGRLAA